MSQMLPLPQFLGLLSVQNSAPDNWWLLTSVINLYQSYKPPLAAWLVTTLSGLYHLQMGDNHGFEPLTKWDHAPSSYRW